MIEAGKFYRTRRGDKIGPAEWMADGVPLGWPWGIGSLMYRPDGTVGGVHDDYNDIVGEWIDAPSPVRTRKEIVGGVFGRIRVLPLYGGRVALRFTSSDSAQLAGLDASELSSAIDTLTIIRDAMAEPTP